MLAIIVAAMLGGADCQGKQDLISCLQSTEKALPVGCLLSWNYQLLIYTPACPSEVCNCQIRVWAQGYCYEGCKLRISLLCNDHCSVDLVEQFDSTQHIVVAPGTVVDAQGDYSVAYATTGQWAVVETCCQCYSKAGATLRLRYVASSTSWPCPCATAGPFKTRTFTCVSCSQ
jgi:hypothetical protein